MTTYSSTGRSAAIRKCAQLILAGRYGRACRTFARAYGFSPRLLKGDARLEWARRYA